MLTVYDCVANQHDLRMVALAALICALGAYATFAIGAHALAMKRVVARRRWLALTVVTSACSIWATHFIAMLSFQVPMPSGFVLLPTVLSFLVAMALVGLAFVVGLRPSGRRRVFAGGTVLGLAISAMHFTGMSAFRVMGDITWDPVAVMASIGLGVAFSIMAVRSAAGRVPARVAQPALWFVLAVCSDHFVAMSAARISFNPAVRLPAHLIDVTGLSIGVAVIALLIVGSTLTAYGLNLRTRRHLAAERRRFEEFADFAVEGLAICDGHTIVWANRGLESLLPGSVGSFVGRSLTSLLPATVVDRLSGDSEIDARLGDGVDATPVRVITKIIQFGGRPHTVVAFRDQRDRLRAEAEMRRLADTDPLTGLANRARFNDVLDRLLSSRRAEEREFALLSLDLDRFKHVNDAHGHAAGDALLLRVAGRLSTIVRQGSLVARIGGDEFSIIAIGLGGPEGVRALADRIVEFLSRPFVIDGHVHEIGTSVGVALAPSDGSTASVLIRSADLALYRAKEDGGSAFRMFESGMDARMQARRGIELALRRAVARQEFHLVYQPQVDAKTGVYTGAEALIRWHDPTRGVVLPSEFIPIAEETNLIAGIGEWVLHTACAEASTWPSHLNIAVNLSPVQFRDPRLYSIVESALAESGLPGHRLELEITESSLIQDEAGVLSVLRAFRELGVRISLDDFGTGYSSLGHLHRFPFDRIKIDRSFVSRAPDDPDCAAIVRAVVSLGTSLGMETTAEGVETDAQRRFVADEGCDQIQGYLFSRPLRVADLPREFRPHPRSTECPRSDFSTEATAS